MELKQHFATGQKRHRTINPCSFHLRRGSHLPKNKKLPNEPISKPNLCATHPTAYAALPAFTFQKTNPFFQDRSDPPPSTLIVHLCPAKHSFRTQHTVCVRFRTGTNLSFSAPIAPNRVESCTRLTCAPPGVPLPSAAEF